jgi:hypothetical protein
MHKHQEIFHRSLSLRITMNDNASPRKVNSKEKCEIENEWVSMLGKAL